MIKIANFVCRLEFGGVESVILNYSDHLSKEDFDLHIVTQDINIQDCIDQFVDKGFTIHIVPHKKRSIIKNVFAVYKLLKNEKYDIVHTHMTLTNFYVLFLAWICGCKVRISHSHNAFHTSNPLKRLMFYTISIVNEWVATDYFACGVDAAKFLFRGTKLTKVFILNNALNLNKYRFDSELRLNLKEKLALSDEFCIGHIGRFSEQKNHKALIQIAKRLKNKDINFIFLLIGDGELFSDIKQIVADENLDNYFIFIGSTTEACKYYQVMDVFVLPSLWEGFPVVGLESQIAGLPCIYSDVIDCRVKILRTTELLDVSDISTWSNRIVYYYTNPVKREVDLKYFRDLGYDIEFEGEKLERFYKDSVLCRSSNRT